MSPDTPGTGSFRIYAQVTEDRMTELEQRINHLEARLDGVRGLLGALHPAGMLLAHHGLSADQQAAVFSVVAEMASRLERGEPAPFSEFADRVMPFVNGDARKRDFLELFVEALRVERPSARRLCDQFTTAMGLWK